MICMTNNITATTADDHKRAMGTYHKPGCAHLRSLEVLGTHEYAIATLQAFQAEAKELGTPNPIAPCLRKEVGK